MKMFKRDHLTVFFNKKTLAFGIIQPNCNYLSDKFWSLFIAGLAETLAFAEFINYSQVLMFAKFLGWAYASARLFGER